MLKLLGSILVIGASAALGLAMRQQSAFHIRVLTEWIDCVNLLILEIGRQGAPLDEAFRTVAHSRNRTLTPLFGELAQRMSTQPESDFRTLWREVNLRHAEDWGAREEERELLLGLSAYLGQYDGAAQVHSLQTAMLRLTELRDAAASDLRSRASLYRSCGAAVGILLVLALI